MIDYSIFLEIPKCRLCENSLITDEVWKRYVKKNKSIYGDNGTLRGRLIGDTIYYRTICEDCYIKEKGVSLPKFNIVSWEFAFIAEVPNVVLSKYFNDNRKVTKTNMIKRYGNILGIQKWEEYLEKQRYSNSKEYHSEKFGRSEKEWNEYNDNRKVTKTNMIKRYGNILGIQKWEEYLEKQRYSETIEYSIKKFGKEEGPKKFKEKCLAKANTLDNMIKRYGKLEGQERWQSLLDNQKSGYSKMASEIFRELESFILNDFPNINLDKIYYLPKNKEYCINKNNRGSFYDFTITDNLNICIEFFGDYFHANPNMFAPNDKPIFFFHPDLTSSDIWERDRYKLNNIIDRGFTTFVIWEEYLKYNTDFTKNFYKNSLLPILKKAINAKRD